MTVDFSIKCAEETDLMDVYNLSNDPVVRANSINKEPILLENHIKWFESKINDENCVFYIVRNLENNDLIGQVRFAKEIDSQNQYVISISIAENFRGKGLGSKLLNETSKKLVNFKEKSSIIAYIKKENAQSYKSFLNAKYIVIDEVSINNEEYYKLEYSGI